MKRVALVLACVVLVTVIASPISAQPSYLLHMPLVVNNADSLTPIRAMIARMDGNAWLYAASEPDGGYTYAGMVTSDPTDANSLINPSGLYGDSASEDSIRNPASPWGSADGPYSAMNPEATDPPLIIWVDWELYGAEELRLTTNAAFAHRIDPELLLQELERRAIQAQ